MARKPIEKVVPTSKRAVDWVLLGPRCRDCADHSGICEQTGLPCDPMLARRAVRHVIERVNYGLSEGTLRRRRPNRKARMMEWQPIDTAPDETDVIVANPDRISGEFHVSIAWRHCESGKWWRPNIGPLPASYIMPTHWMPLPAPPTTEE
jgi:hypothetical protein